MPSSILPNRINSPPPKLETRLHYVWFCQVYGVISCICYLWLWWWRAVERSSQVPQWIRKANFLILWPAKYQVRNKAPSLKTEDKIHIMCYLFSNSGGSDKLVWSNGGIKINRAKLKKLGCLTSEKNLVCMNVCIVSLGYLWICQLYLFPSALYLNYLLLVRAFWPSLGVHIHHCLHCTPLYIGQREYDCAHLMMAKRLKHIVDN
jgi:hypothetical protein